MKKNSIIAAAAAAVLIMSGCADAGSSNPPADTPAPAGTAAPGAAETAAEEAPADPGYDFTGLAAASNVSALVAKYGCISVEHNMNYGEDYHQKMTFFAGPDGKLSYIGDLDGDLEYYDGISDYWKEDDEGYVYIGIGGEQAVMDMNSYIFSYDEEDNLKVDGITDDNGGKIISASEVVADLVDDLEEEDARTLRYEYMFRTNADNELTELKCSCTDVDTGEVDSTLEMKVELGVDAPEMPDFMSETFELNTVTLGANGIEVDETFEVPVGFQPFFVTPKGGTFTFAWDREGKDVITDTRSVTGPCTIYIILKQ